MADYQGGGRGGRGGRGRDGGGRGGGRGGGKPQLASQSWCCMGCDCALELLLRCHLLPGGDIRKR